MAPEENEFEQASREARKSTLREIGEFLWSTKKYWLIPVVIVFVALAALVAIGGGAAAPFIYTLF
jgi:hypothetical protein